MPKYAKIYHAHYRRKKCHAIKNLMELSFRIIVIQQLVTVAAISCDNKVISGRKRTEFNVSIEFF